GTTKTIFYGGILIMLGHIALAIPLNGLIPLFTSIGLLVIGTGLLKPNISSAVGDLYSKEDFRRDSGFNVFYTGINMGGLDRKSTRLNSSHVSISYAVFCLKK